MILAVLHSSLIVSGIIRMSFVSLAGFIFSMACFYLPANRIFNSIYVPKGVKLKKIQKTLPHASFVERFNHVLLLMQTTENQRDYRALGTNVNSYETNGKCTNVLKQLV